MTDQELQEELNKVRYSLENGLTWTSISPQRLEWLLLQLIEKNGIIQRLNQEISLLRYEVEVRQRLELERKWGGK